MQYTEQLFDNIFPNFLEDRQKTYLKGKVSIREISHFAKTFAVEFFNEKSKHLNLDDLEENQRQGQENIVLKIIKSLDNHKANIEKEMKGYQELKNYRKKQVEIYQNRIYEISECKLIIQSIYKSILNYR